MKKYKVTLFSFDGDAVSDGFFENIDSAERYINDLGSKWYFYPFAFVTTTKTVISSLVGLEFLSGKRIKTVKILFKKVFDATVENEVDESEFIDLLRKNYFEPNH